MTRLHAVVALIVLAASMQVCPAQAEPITAFYYTSSPESWVGQGKTVLVTPADGFGFYCWRQSASGFSYWVDDLATNHIQCARWWTFEIEVPAGQVMQVGQYLNATRYPFQEPQAPGLDVFGNGRGSNIVSGSFEILEVSLGPDNSLLSVAVDFVHYGEGLLSWWVIGGFRYNSSIPVPAGLEPTPQPICTPEPSAFGLVGVCLLLGIPFARSQRRKVALAGRCA
jgi:hypothetical protein